MGSFVSTPVLTHTFDNGLVLIGQPMDWLESAAFTMLVPAGSAWNPADRGGLSNFACELAQRGCGARDSRQFIEDLDNLGVERSGSTTISHTSFGGAMQASRLDDALAIYADLLRRPHLPEDQLEDTRLVCLQELHAVEDDLSQRTFIELRRRRYADPWGRSTYGTRESIANISIKDVRTQIQQTYRPNGTIISVAGKIDWDRLVETIGNLFGDWTTVAPPEIVETPAEGGYHHIEHDSSQTHIGIAYPSVPYCDKDYYQARGAIGVLSDGSSSRLFTEIRERRGLCYSVFALSHSLCDRGSVLCYCGTGTDRAQESLDVLLAELQRLTAGIEQDELNRLKARIKSTLIMQLESSVARSVAVAWDWYHLSRVQTPEEIGRIIDALTCESINAYLAEHPPKDFTIVTLGAKPLEVR